MIVYLVLPLLAVFASFLALYLLSGNEDYFVIAYSFLIVAPVAWVAAIHDRNDLFAPLKILTYILLVSSPLFCLYVYYLADDWRIGYALFWQPFDDLIPGITLLGYGVMSILLGYHLMTRRVQNVRRYSSSRSISYSRERIRIVAAVTILIALLAVFSFASDVNYATMFADDILSRKSIHDATIGVSPRGSALTHWRLLGISLPQAVVIIYAALAWSKRIRVSRLDYVLVVFLLLLSFAIPFIASSRTPILEIAIVLLLLWNYLVRPLRLSQLIVPALIGVMVVGTLGQMRRDPDNVDIVNLRFAAETILGASNFIDLGKTAIVVNRVPDEVGYLWGSSLVSIGIAAIPRTIWPEKPIVRVGYFVGQEIIGLNNQTGIPPGFIAEMYLNFGYLSILPALMLVGFLMYVMYQRIDDRREFVPVIIYSVGILVVTLSLLSADFTYALGQTLAYAAPLYLILRFVAVPGTLASERRNSRGVQGRRRGSHLHRDNAGRVQ